jgi:hypothetical protein
MFLKLFFQNNHSEQTKIKKIIRLKIQKPIQNIAEK